MVQKTTATAD